MAKSIRKYIKSPWAYNMDLKDWLKKSLSVKLSTKKKNKSRKNK